MVAAHAMLLKDTQSARVGGIAEHLVARACGIGFDTVFQTSVSHLFAEYRFSHRRSAHIGKADEQDLEWLLLHARTIPVAGRAASAQRRVPRSVRLGKGRMAIR